MTVEEQVNGIEKALIKVDERSKSNKIRLDEIETEMKETNSLVAAIKELAIETKYMRSDLNETIQRLSKLEGRDLEKWDKFKWLIAAGLITIVLGFIAVQVGLK